MLAVTGLYQGSDALGSIKHYWGVLRLEGKKRLQIQSPISARLVALVLVQEDKHEESRGSQHPGTGDWLNWYLSSFYQGCSALAVDDDPHLDV
jgi:hypothetical protein